MNHLLDKLTEIYNQQLRKLGLTKNKGDDEIKWVKANNCLGVAPMLVGKSHLMRFENNIITSAQIQHDIG
jgi:hypothetical protein